MKTRNCPLCNSPKSSVVHTQKYDAAIVHKIVLCDVCGFAYVKNTRTPEEYAKYYTDTSIYEYTRDEDIHDKSVKIIKKQVPKKSRVLDVGSSTGNLLHLLKKNGYDNTIGIDPSPKCSEIAKEKYNVKVVPSDLQSFEDKSGFGLIILNNVLEHLPDVQESVQKLKELLKKDGYLYIAVPDEGNCYKHVVEPFYEFSFEHINFFSIESLYYLFIHFRAVEVFTDGKVIYSLWQKGGKLENSMKKYIEQSNKKLTEINKRILKKLPRNYLVWGAGSLTRRLLYSTDLKPAKIIDRNPHLIGQKIKNVEIIDPGQVPNYPYPILICSYRYKEEISNYITKSFNNTYIVLP